jgi:hypothetical protein
VRYARATMTAFDHPLLVYRSLARPAAGESCKWCSGLSKRGYLYRFWSQQRGYHRGLFCSRSCHDAFYGMYSRESRAPRRPRTLK